jgi:D-amino-acid oxidase
LTRQVQLYQATYLWCVEADVSKHSNDAYRYSHRDHADDRQPEDSHWWTKSFIPGFRVLSPDEVAEQGLFAAGMNYETFALCPTRYLAYLQGQCEAQGIPCRTAAAAALSLLPDTDHDVFAMAEFAGVIGIVNCTGVAAAMLTGDTRAYPSKGQTVIVAGAARRVATRRGREGWEALVIPWPGTNETMLGGCKIPGEWSTTPDPAITQMILDRCKPLAPELLNAHGEFEVRQVRVGLRPARRGGPRMELERCRQGKFICHAYGHDSAG